MSSTAKTEEERPEAALNGAHWATSQARQLMAQDLLDGLIAEKYKAEEVYNRLYAQQPEFSDFPFDNTRYRTRINSLRKIIKRTKGWAKYDDDALKHDRAVCPPASHDIRGGLRWDGSDAQNQLKLDVSNGFVVGKTVTEIFQHPDRPEYRLFTDEVFRKHLDQFKEANKEFGATPGQMKSRQPKGKLGHKKFKRSSSTSSPSTTTTAQV